MYDFDTVVDRRNTGSLKWDVAENELPMWVADMDFLAIPSVRMSGMMRIFRGGTDAMGLKSKETA